MQEEGKVEFDVGGLPVVSYQSEDCVLVEVVPVHGLLLHVRGLHYVLRVRRVRYHVDHLLLQEHVDVVFEEAAVLDVSEVPLTQVVGQVQIVKQVVQHLVEQRRRLVLENQVVQNCLGLRLHISDELVYLQLDLVHRELLGRYVLQDVLDHVVHVQALRRAQHRLPVLHDVKDDLHAGDNPVLPLLLNVLPDEVEVKEY